MHNRKKAGLGLHIEKDLKDFIHGFAKKASIELELPDDCSPSSLHKNLEETKKKLENLVKSFKEDLNSPDRELPPMIKNVALAPVFYKIFMTDLLMFYAERNRSKDLENISHGKLTRKQIEERASAKDFKSFAHRKVMDLLIGMGASPKLPLIVLQGPGFIGSAMEISVHSANYNALKALDKYPDTNPLFPNMLRDEIIGSGDASLYGKSAPYKDLFYFSQDFWDGFPAKFGENKPVNTLAKELHGEDLYLFINTVQIKNHFLDKFKDINTLISPERNPKNNESKLYSPLHILAQSDPYQKSSLLSFNMLMSRGADINLKNTKGDSPTHVAAREGNKEFVQYAISRNANLNCLNNDGESPLELAKKSFLSLTKHTHPGDGRLSDFKDIISLITLNKGLSQNLTRENGTRKQSAKFQPAFTP